MHLLRCRNKTVRVAFFLIVTLALIGCRPAKSIADDTSRMEADKHFTLRHDGRDREYYVHVPPTYNEHSHLPVVIYFHGGGGSLKGAYRDGLASFADSLGFILVDPAGTGFFDERLLTWNGGSWSGGSCCGFSVKKNIDDVGFVSALIDEVSKKFSIDNRRVYATGISNGGIMSYRLACELPNKIAAVAAVAPPAVPSNCRPRRPVAVMHVHGTADPCAPFKGGEGGGCIGRQRMMAQSAEEMVEFWARNNHCTKATSTTYQRGEAKCVSYDQCAESANVEYCVIQGGGHIWPSGNQYMSTEKVGHVSHDLSFEQMWAFLSKHSLP